uniref:Ras-GEF domain-containing protein n=1 Tax=Macrostomum lignano TaxID=282301 RepID=A0A1I8JPA8_9PLAT
TDSPAIPVSPVVQTRQSAVCGDTRAPVGGPSSSTTAGTASAAAAAAAAPPNSSSASPPPPPPLPQSGDLRIHEDQQATVAAAQGHLDDVVGMPSLASSLTMQPLFRSPSPGPAARTRRPRLYSYGRSLIPRFFHSLLRNCDEAFVRLRSSQEVLVSAPPRPHPPGPPPPPSHLLIVTSPSAELVTTYCRCQPVMCKILTEISLIIEFFLDDMRSPVEHGGQAARELVPRCVLTAAPPAAGRRCEELMTLQKQLGQPPRQCLQSALYHKWLRKAARLGNGVDPASGVSRRPLRRVVQLRQQRLQRRPTEVRRQLRQPAAPRQPPRRSRRRSGKAPIAAPPRLAEAGVVEAAARSRRRKAPPPPPLQPLQPPHASGPGGPNDVMVVLEPSLMGGVGGGGGGGGGGCGYGPPPLMAPGGGGSNSAAARQQQRQRRQQQLRQPQQPSTPRRSTS